MNIVAIFLLRKVVTGWNQNNADFYELIRLTTLENFWAEYGDCFYLTDYQYTDLKNGCFAMLFSVD